MAFLQENPTKTQELFHKLNSYTSLMGRLDLWDQGNHPGRKRPIYTKFYYVFFYKFINLFMYALVVLEVSAFVKRDQFNTKEMSDWCVFTFSNPLLYSFYLSVLYYKNEVKELLLCLTVLLKKVYNDEEVEQRMIKRAKIYMAAYLVLCSLALFLYGFDSLIQVIRLDKTFVTLILAWPDKDDTSNLASTARVVFYITWWMVVIRSSNGYLLAIASTICLSHQFQNLKSYFYKLDNIFDEQDLTQKEKENKYEKAIKVGIKLHSDTLWCTRQCQIVYGLGYSGQITICLMGLAILMFQLVNSERTVLNALAIMATASTILVTTGIFMWNAGDVTVEASGLATAMYSSGWQNCQKESSVRIQKLLVVAMAQAQKPVVIRGFGGIMELSYGSYVSIVKSSYSVFSVVY